MINTYRWERSYEDIEDNWIVVFLLVLYGDFSADCIINLLNTRKRSVPHLVHLFFIREENNHE